MPLQTTLGALATVKLAVGNYWLVTLASTSGKQVVTNLFISNEKILCNWVSTPYNATAYPNLLSINISKYQIPSFDNYIVFDSNANSTANGAPIFTNNVIEFNQNIIINQNQKININGNLMQSEIIRKFDSNINYIEDYVNLPYNTSDNLNYRSTHGIHKNNDNTFITNGYMRNGGGAANVHNYITNYYSNLTIQWEKYYSIGGTALFLNPRMQDAGNNNILLYGVPGRPVAEIDGTTGNINYQFTVTYQETEYALMRKEGNNIYFSATTTQFGSFNGGIVGKIINNNNISWQKQLDNNHYMYQGADYYNGNIYISALDLSTNAGKIINIDGNTGNINWVNKINITGTGPFSNIVNNSATNLIYGIITKNDGMYLTFNVGNNFSYCAQVIAKFPSDGSIEGNGNYSINTNIGGLINLSYSTSNISMSNTNATIAIPNISVTNANIANTIISNITGNTTMPYTFNSTQV